MSPEAGSGRAPGGAWLRTWLLALGLGFVSLVLWEASWRAAGHAPGPVDDAELWAVRRLGLGTSRRAVAVVGDSRALVGIDLERLGVGFQSRRPVQLAIHGSTPLPVLIDLARDERFRGLALATISPLRFCDASLASSRLPEEYLKVADRMRASPAARAEAVLGDRLRRASLLGRAELSPAVLLQMRRWPRTRTLRSDRSRPMRLERDAETRALEREQTRLLAPLPQARGARLAELVGDAALAVHRIESRGGAVVLVRMPSDHLHRRIERQRAPRERCWDPLVSATAAPAIHFEDHPELERFECPDGSHLDARDVPPFTRALAARVRAEMLRAGDGRFGEQATPAP